MNNVGTIKNKIILNKDTKCQIQNNRRNSQNHNFKKALDRRYNEEEQTITRSQE